MVKTRLAGDIGNAAASRVYRIMAERIIAQTRPGQTDYDRMIFYCPGDAEQTFRDWLPGEEIVRQRGTDIGEIMENAFCHMFGNGAEKAIVAGTDIPGLDSNVIGGAFRELDHADVVIGPAVDGGYYLIGMKSPLPDIFRGIKWGTGEVFERTLRLTARLGLTAATVEPLADVDTFDDLSKVMDLYPDYFDNF